MSTSHQPSASPSAPAGRNWVAAGRWMLLFAVVAVGGAVATWPKYQQRTAQIEAKFQSRQAQGQATLAGSSTVPHAPHYKPLPVSRIPPNRTAEAWLAGVFVGALILGSLGVGYLAWRVAGDSAATLAPDPTTVPLSGRSSLPE